MRSAPRVTLSKRERTELHRWSEGHSRLSRRARIVLAAARGRTNRDIARVLGVGLETVGRWRRRFVESRSDGLLREAPRAGAADRVPRSTIARILRATVAELPAASPRWTTRTLARSLGVNHMLVHRVWKAYGLERPGPGRPPRPESGPTCLDLAGVFVAPGVRAVVFSREASLRASEEDLRWPTIEPNPTGSPMFVGLREREASIVRAVESIGGPVRDPPAPSPTTYSFLVYLRELDHRTSPSTRLEVVLDRPLARLGRMADRWFDSHPRFRIYTTPTSRPWATTVEGWIARWRAAELDRASYSRAPELAETVPTRGARARTGPIRWTWWPTGASLALSEPGSPHLGSDGPMPRRPEPAVAQRRPDPE